MAELPHVTVASLTSMHKLIAKTKKTIARTGPGQQAAGALTVVVSAIVLTPFCGLMFNCGCTWPWAGLEAHCNIHDVTAVHQCPWCSSYLAGGLSSLIAIGGAAWLALGFPEKSGPNRPIPGFSTLSLLKNTLTGLAGFLLIALVAGWLAATMQNYPTFLIY